jgi:Flp pilus assembly protein TadG
VGKKGPHAHPFFLRHPGREAGAATVELAALLPFLCFLFVAAVDSARIFYDGITVQNCARNGACYASNYPNSSYVFNDVYGYATLAVGVSGYFSMICLKRSQAAGNDATGAMKSSPPRMTADTTKM